MLQCAKLARLSGDKYSSLFGPFVAYEENEVLWIQLLVSISPIFYEQIFCAKVFLRSFYVLTILVCNILAKGFWRKSCE